MKLEPLYNKLALRLPQFTNLFSTQLAVSSLTQTGGTATLVTSSPHGLGTSSQLVNVNVQGGRIRTQISSIEISGTTATATTSTPHDLTEDFPGFETITIANSSEAELNGTFTLLTVPNRKKFTFRINTSPVSITTPGDLLEDRLNEYNGTKIATIVDSTTLTYSVSSSLPSPADGTNIQLNSPPCITIAMTEQSAADAYTSKLPNQYSMFIVPGPTTTSLDRRNADDGRGFAQLSTGTVIRLIDSFSLLVFSPSSQTFNAGELYDEMMDVKAAIFRSIVADNIDSGFTRKSKDNLSLIPKLSSSTIVPTNDEPVFNAAIAGSNGQPVLIHSFGFEVQTNIEQEQIHLNTDHVAFRDVDLTFFNNFDQSGEVIMTATVDLDDNPI